MNISHTLSAHSDETPVEIVPEHISQNIDSILAFYRREEQKISDSQRLLETVGGFMGRPSYLACSPSLRFGFWLIQCATCSDSGRWIRRHFPGCRALLAWVH